MHALRHVNKRIAVDVSDASMHPFKAALPLLRPHQPCGHRCCHPACCSFLAWFVSFGLDLLECNARTLQCIQSPPGQAPQAQQCTFKRDSKSRAQNSTSGFQEQHPSLKARLKHAKRTTNSSHSKSRAYQIVNSSCKVFQARTNLAPSPGFWRCQPKAYMSLGRGFGAIWWKLGREREIVRQQQGNVVAVNNCQTTTHTKRTATESETTSRIRNESETKKQKLPANQ